MRNLRMHAYKDDGFTLVELLMVAAIMSLIAAIAVPGLLRGRIAGNEASAIGSMRTLSGGQASFASTCGGGGYANTLADLALVPVAGGSGFIPADLGAADPAGTPKSGYVFTIAGGGAVVLAAADTCSATVNDTTTQFFAQGDPFAPGSTGTRFFATDESGQMRQDTAQLPDMSAGTPLK